MNNIENQFQKIVKSFPNVKTFNNLNSLISIQLNKGVSLEIDYGKFPKKPKVKLINQNGDIIKHLDRFIHSLKNWNSHNPKPILEIIKEVEIFTSGTILIKEELLGGILTLCREHHPKEIIGILKMEKYVFNEFIVPPGTYTSRTSGIFSPSRLPLDLSYQASVHSHPSGTPLPSKQDKAGVFKGFRCHFIVGFPYGLKDVRCYDKNGKELHFAVVK